MPHSNDVTRPPRPRRRRSRIQRWYVLFLVVVGFGVLGASLAVGLMMGYINSLPPIEALEEYAPIESTIIYDRTGAREIAELADERRHVLPIEEIPDMMKKAVLAIEDDRFDEHFGVDPWAIARSAVANFKSSASSQGASTITMQLPRNILPEEYSREKKWSRKIKEAVMAFKIERRYSKDQILAFYLNHIDMGRQSFGIYSAAQTYFDKEPKDLTLAECASLAAIPKGPSMYNPLGVHNKERHRGRRDYVLKRMRELNWISAEQYDRAVNSPVLTRPGRRRSNVATSDFPYFTDALQRELTGYYKLSESDLRKKGLRIRSTIDPTIQKIAQEELSKGLIHAESMWQDRKPARFQNEATDLPPGPVAGQMRLMRIKSRPTSNTLEVTYGNYTGTMTYKNGFPYYNSDIVLKAGGLIDAKVIAVDSRRQRMELEPGDTKKIQGSVVVMDARTAEVYALVGGDNFFDTANDGQFNRAYMGGKSAGSTVKPFFFAAALEIGFKPHDIIIDEEISIPSVPEPYKPRNYEKRFFGPTTLIEALEHSRNVPTVRLFLKMGVKRALNQVVEFDYHPGHKTWLDRYPHEVSVCLGTVDMSALDVASAYQVFTHRGICRRPQFFETLTDKAGKKLLSPKRDETIALDPVVAYQMVNILRQAVVDGTGKTSIGDKFPSPPYPPIGGKTGTTNDNTDAWFTGITPDLVICVYVGYDTPRSMGPQMTGGKIAGPIWANTFARTYATRDPSQWKMSYEAPPGIETADICSETGKRASELCAENRHKVYRRMPYKRGTAPFETCDGAVRSPLIGRQWVSFEAEGEAEAPTVDDPMFADPNSAEESIE